MLETRNIHPDIPRPVTRHPEIRRPDPRKRLRGGAVIEITLMAPWIFFLFVGVFDMGFYNYAAISTQNAARAAAMRTATMAQTTTEACQAALDEMKILPNVGNLASCGALPIIVSLTTLCGTSTPTSIACSARPTSPTCADCAVDPTASSVQATVTYQSVNLIPIPGLLPGRVTFVRKAEMRIVQ
jgi:Flp pilus assembly protein TadG